MDGSPSDATLLAAIGERDLEAMRALHERHAAWLSVRLTRRYADRDAVADTVQDACVAVHGNHERAAADGGEDQVDGAQMPTVSPVAAEQIGGRPQRGVAASLTLVRWLTPWAPGSLRPSVRSIRAATQAWPFSGPARTGLRGLARSEPI